MFQNNICCNKLTNLKSDRLLTALKLIFITNDDNCVTDCGLTYVDSMTASQRQHVDKDQSHLKNIAMELKEILRQLHSTKKASFDVWEGNKANQKSILTNRIGSDYEVQYVRGKVTDDDLADKSLSSYQSPDADRFQQDVWEPGSRGEGTMFGGKAGNKTVTCFQVMFFWTNH